MFPKIAHIVSTGLFKWFELPRALVKNIPAKFGHEGIFSNEAIEPLGSATLCEGCAKTFSHWRAILCFPRDRYSATHGGKAFGRIHQPLCGCTARLSEKQNAWAGTSSRVSAWCLPGRIIQSDQVNPFRCCFPGGGIRHGHFLPHPAASQPHGRGCPC